MTATTMPTWLSRAQFGLVAVLLMLMTFWSASDYAKREGLQAAEDAVTSSRLPMVDLYSKNEIHLRTPGVRPEPLGGDAGDYRYAYFGLRLLIRAGDKYFLFSGNSEGDRAATRWSIVVLPESPDIRLEYTPARSAG